MQSSVEIGPAAPQDRRAVFRLAFQHLPARERETRVGNALGLIERGELDPAGVLCASARGQVLGAMICMTAPGASGLVWPPQASGSVAERCLVEDRLVETASAWLRLRRAKLAQALLTPAEAGLADPLERNGFTHVTRLLYLRHGLELTAPALTAPQRLQFLYYPDDPERFHETLLRTYIDSQDCPEVTGVRTIEEIIEGHRAQGNFVADRWLLAQQGARQVGVLLLTDTPELNSWDVSYVGVVPEARRHGFGTELLCKALVEARAGGADQLTLSVDARNKPALGLYRRLGFEMIEDREVYLAIWHRPG
jgi:ribosomal protein S18 acetylase RimI-like enzyme